MVDEEEKKKEKKSETGEGIYALQDSYDDHTVRLRCAVRDFGYIDKPPAHTQLPKSLLWIQGSPWGFRVATVGA